MDTGTYRDTVKKHILENIKLLDKGEITVANFFKTWTTPNEKTEVIWILSDLVKEGKSLDSSLVIAEHLSNDSNPEKDYDNLNKKIEEGSEDPRNIYTVRGTVPWLLQAIAATLETKYYKRVIDILEKLVNDDIFYVRQQATVPLSFLAANIRAEKNPNGTPFDFGGPENRIRVLDLAFKMLRDNRNLPRVLEYVVNVFDRLRYINEKLAQESLERFFYSENGVLNPSYLIEHVAPLAMFYAEFRKKFDAKFQNEWFQKFLLKLIKDSNKYDQRLKSVFVWNTWKLIQDNAEDYALFKKYIPFFLEGNFEHEPLGQYEFLIKEVLNVNPNDGLQLLLQELDYIEKGVVNSHTSQQIWLLSMKEIVEEVAKKLPNELLNVLKKIQHLIYLNVNVGEIDSVFRSYKLAENKEKIKEEVLKLYGQIREKGLYSNLPQL